MDGHKILAPVASLNKPQQVLLRLRVRLVAIVKLDVSDGMLSAYSQGGFVTQTVGGALPVNYPLTGTSRTIALSLAPDATSSNLYTEIPQYISPSKQGFTWYGVAQDNAEHPVNGSWIAMVL